MYYVIYSNGDWNYFGSLKYAKTRKGEGIIYFGKPYIRAIGELKDVFKKRKSPNLMI